MITPAEHFRLYSNEGHMEYTMKGTLNIPPYEYQR